LRGGVLPNKLCQTAFPTQW